MGHRKYPPLTPRQVIANIQAHGFCFKRQDGSHAQYEKSADKTNPRKIVTVDVGKKEFSVDLIKSMIRQSGLTRDEFYGE